MRVLRSELDRGLDRFFERAVDELTHGHGTSARGVVELDLVETEDAFFISADVPGMKREQIELTIDDNHLTLTGNRALDRKDESKRHVSERRSYALNRRFELPKNVVVENTEAKLSDGVLEVTIPKTPEEEPRKIDIRLG